MIETATENIMLSEEQKAIVFHNNGEGPLLAIAAAGSGKTRILTERARYLLTTKPGNFGVLCLTFTNKAAEEMQERLKNVRNITNRAFIGTIHAFALEVLATRRHLIGFGKMPQIIDRENDRKKIIEEAVWENVLLRNLYEAKTPKEKTQFLDTCAEIISELKRNLVIFDLSTGTPEGMEAESYELYTSYNARLREQYLIDFDDILLLTWQIFNENPFAVEHFRRLYRYILVDEAQDLNYAQYNLLRTLCGDTHRNVFMVGDPNQSVHGYAGADKKFMCTEFLQDFGATKMQVAKNYRSSQAVIDFAQRIVPNGVNSNAHYLGEAQVLAFPNESTEADWVISKIRFFLEKGRDEQIEGDITLENMVVLARNKFVFRILQSKLEQNSDFAGHFFLKKGTESLDMESRLMKLFDLGTRILTNPLNQIHFRQLCSLLSVEPATSPLRLTGFDKLSSLKKLLLEDERVRSEFDLLLETWNLIAQRNEKLPQALNTLNEYTKNAAYPEEEKAFILWDIEDYRNTWKQYCANYAAGNISLSSFRQFAALGFGIQQKNKGLTLATVHTVKGLEFDIVFVIGMNQGTFPDYRADNEKKLEEEKNAAYVAFTRACRYLFVTYPQRKMMPWGEEKRQSPSLFIKDINIISA